MNKTHYKKFFNPDYLGAYSLEPGQDLVLTIRELKTEKVKNADGREDDCFVCYFAEDVKPMILNATNSKQIAALYKSPYVEDWIGKKIQVYAAKIKAFGEMMEALRIRPVVPKGRETLTADRLGKMIEAIQAGRFTIEQAKERFALTADQLKQIESATEKTEA